MQLDRLRLKARLGANPPDDPDDIHNTMMLLASLGFDDQPKHRVGGPSKALLLKSIGDFQSEHGLKRDRVMNPGGETERVLNEVLAGRPGNGRPIPSASGKTLLTRPMSSPTATPRIPPGKLNTGNQSKSTVSLPKQGQAQPSPVAITTNRTSGQRLNPGGSGHHSRATDIDPDRAKRIAVVDREQARETREDLVELIGMGRSRGLRWAPLLLQHYIGRSGKTITLPADFVREAPSIARGELRARGHFKNWFTNAKGTDAQKDSTFGEVTDWIAKNAQELDITGMTWKATGEGNLLNRKIDGDLDWDKIRQDKNIADASDGNLSFGGATVEATIIDGKLVRQQDGSIKVIGIVEFRAKDTYKFEEDGILHWLPIPQAAAAGRIISPSHLEHLENYGGAKQFEVTSETWKVQVSGTIMDAKGVFVGDKINWTEISPSNTHHHGAAVSAVK